MHKSKVSFFALGVDKALEHENSNESTVFW